MVALKLGAVYSTAEEGKRGGILVDNLDDPSAIPAVAEPWFQACNAKVEFLPVVLPEDLKMAGATIEDAVRRYGWRPANHRLARALEEN